MGSVLRVAPIDVVVIVAARDRDKHHQKRHLARRMHDAAGRPRIPLRREAIEQRAQAWLDRFMSTFISSPKITMTC